MLVTSRAASCHCASCLHIDSGEDLQFACLWVHACIVAHLFAMDFDKSTNVEDDAFFSNGLAIACQERKASVAASVAANQTAGPSRACKCELCAAWEMCESLKETLFHELGMEQTHGQYNHINIINVMYKPA